jgi:hypothetical protein
VRNLRLAFALATLAALASLALGACHDSDSGGGATAFDPFVTDLIQNGTDETSEPEEVDGTTFSFPTEEDAFDDVLPPDTGAVVQ